MFIKPIRDSSSTFNNGKAEPLWTQTRAEKSGEHRNELLRELQA